MSDLKVGDIVEHVHPGCYRDGGVGVIKEIEPTGIAGDDWYHVRWMIANPRADEHGEEIVRFVKRELTLRSEP